MQFYNVYFFIIIYAKGVIMPIDFHSNFVFNTNKPFLPRSAQQTFINKNSEKDTFTKSIQVNNNSIDKNYDGIKIEKKSFGKIKKSGEDATLYTITNKNGARDRKSTRLNSSHDRQSRMPSSA